MCALIALAAACSGGDERTVDEPGVDAAVDATGDAAADATADTAVDTTPEPDVAVDTTPEPDVAVDTTPEPDVAVDTTPELDAAPEVDLGPDPLDIDDDGDRFTENEGDCNDDDNTVFPGAFEICENGIDDDCDSVVDDVGTDTETLGPTEYLQASDSPWIADDALDVFVLEDFEDQMLPEGVTASTFRWSSSFSLEAVDSVDGDDGEPTDGRCNPCEAMWSGGAITFTFDPVALGGIPTHVGVVVTDAGAANVTVTLSATSTCTDLGALTSSITFGDGSVGGETAEDRFVGFMSPAGITSMTISVGAPLEVDHLQFGW